MATPPSFTAGSVLTAAQMNAVGLWRITTCTVSSVGGTAATASNGVITIGTGNTSITVSNAFSADYDNYLIEVSGVSASATNNLLLQLSGATGSTYYTNLMYWGWGSAALNGYGPAAATTMVVCQAYIGEPYAWKLDLFNPNLARRTYGFLNQTGANNGGVGQVMETSTAQHTGFTFSTSSGTITGGKIRVYGYNN